ncbi:MAG TPA: hypothetical protein VIG64_14430, partial [Actinomycetota bacterium]
MRKKLSSLLLGMCLVAGMLVTVAAPASAQRPFGVQQFMPQDQFVHGNCGGGPPPPPNCEPDSLSDKFDGLDSLAHLTVVATPETTQVTWYACPLGTVVTTQAALSSCSVTIGTDTTGVAPPIGPGASSPADEAYDVTWDIPGSLDHQRRDIAALACINTAQQVEGANANCRVDEENDIFLEDAQTGAAANQTTSAEFGPYRTMQGCIGLAPGSTCDAARKPFPHGSPVPNDGFDFQVFTSDDLTALVAIVNEDADATTEPAGANSLNGPPCNVEQTFTNFKRWLCIMNDANIPDDAEMAINLVDATNMGTKPEGSGGYCNSQNNPSSAPSAQNTVQGAHDFCILDAHYVVSSVRQPARVLQSFGANPPSPGANAGCFPGATPDTDETSELGTQEDFMICMLDQFNDPFSGQWTEETAGAGQIADCGPYTAHDHNGDGVIDDCHGATGGALGTSANMTVANPVGPVGDQVITSCFDPQNQAVNPPPPNHGCADAPANLKATITVHWGTTATEVFLTYNNPAPSNASDPCRTGTTFKANEVGDHDDITVCTFDSSGNRVPTDT